MFAELDTLGITHPIFIKAEQPQRKWYPNKQARTDDDEDQVQIDTIFQNISTKRAYNQFIKNRDKAIAQLSADVKTTQKRKTVSQLSAAFKTVEREKNNIMVVSDTRTQ